MNWNALKSYKCPKCASDLKDIGDYHACSRRGCFFSINKAKFDSIVSQKFTPRREPTDDERLAEWNNYGRKPMSEDFSDSPFL